MKQKNLYLPIVSSLEIGEQTNESSSKITLPLEAIPPRKSEREHYVETFSKGFASSAKITFEGWNEDKVGKFFLGLGLTILNGYGLKESLKLPT